MSMMSRDVVQSLMSRASGPEHEHSLKKEWESGEGQRISNLVSLGPKSVSRSLMNGESQSHRGWRGVARTAQSSQYSVLGEYSEKKCSEYQPLGKLRHIDKSMAS